MVLKGMMDWTDHKVNKEFKDRRDHKDYRVKLVHKEMME
jgi:hypothetical protein